MVVKRNILFLTNGIFLMLLLYFSGFNKTVELHITEFIFLVNCLALYLLSGKRNLFFITYLYAFILAQFLFVSYIVFRLEYLISAIGGIVFLITYVSMIMYVLKTFRWKNLKPFSIITGITIVLLICWILYYTNNIVINEQEFTDLINHNPFHNIMIYSYFAFIFFLTTLGILNLSIHTDSWNVLFCLSVTCALLSELSQIFQYIYYRGDTIGIVNIIDKSFSVASMYLFYLSTESRKRLKKSYNR